MANDYLATYLNDHLAGSVADGSSVRARERAAKGRRLDRREINSPQVDP
jgi:hypothetical protein